MTADALDLSIVIPAHNEAQRLPATLAALAAALSARPWRSEVVVVDDGSTDGTAAVAAGVGRPIPTRVIALQANRGKGAAVTRGIREARGACVGFVDADLPYALDGLDLAMARLAGGADVVIGDRRLPGSSEVRGYTWTRRLSGDIYSVMVNRLAVRGIPDTQCGFKWFRAPVARELFARVSLSGFAFDVELLTIAQHWRLRIDRIPVRFHHSDDSRIRLVRDSARMFRDLIVVNRRRARGAYERGLTGGG